MTRTTFTSAVYFADDAAFRAMGKAWRAAFEAGTGVLFDATLTAEALQLAATPIPAGMPAYSGDPCPWAWSGAAGAVITLEILQLEA